VRGTRDVVGDPLDVSRNRLSWSVALFDDVAERTGVPVENAGRPRSRITGARSFVRTGGSCCCPVKGWVVHGAVCGRGVPVAGDGAGDDGARRAAVDQPGGRCCGGGAVPSAPVAPLPICRCRPRSWWCPNRWFGRRSRAGRAGDGLADVCRLPEDGRWRQAEAHRERSKTQAARCWSVGRCQRRCRWCRQPTDLQVPPAALVSRGTSRYWRLSVEGVWCRAC